MEELISQGENPPFMRSLDSLFSLFGNMPSVYSGITFFLSPFLFMLAPAIVFEEQGAQAVLVSPEKCAQVAGHGLIKANELLQKEYYTTVGFNRNVNRVFSAFTRKHPELGG